MFTYFGYKEGRIILKVALEVVMSQLCFSKNITFFFSINCREFFFTFPPHWHPVRAWTDFKILLLTFKVIHGLAPKYLSNLSSFK